MCYRHKPLFIIINHYFTKAKHKELGAKLRVTKQMFVQAKLTAAEI